MFRKLTKHELAKVLLASRERGKMEVRCKFGVVDVVTKAEAIEVKNYRYWKQALGQALVYGKATEKLPRVHLFGGKRLPQEYEEVIGALGCRLSYHWDDFDAPRKLGAIPEKAGSELNKQDSPQPRVTQDEDETAGKHGPGQRDAHGTDDTPRKVVSGAAGV